MIKILEICEIICYGSCIPVKVYWFITYAYHQILHLTSDSWVAQTLRKFFAEIVKYFLKFTVFCLLFVFSYW